MKGIDIQAIWPQWEVLEQIGRGPWAVVYRVRRREGVSGGEAFAALKVVTLPPEGEVPLDSLSESQRRARLDYYRPLAEKLAGEYRLLEGLSGHPNLVGCLGSQLVQREDGRGWKLYALMELLTPLPAFAAARPLSTEDVVRLGICLCKALEACHANGLIHKDLRPENIFTQDGSVYKLGAPGLGHALGNGMEGPEGQSPYTAPELRRLDAYGPNVDVYSLGMVLYQLLHNGQLLPPFGPAPQPSAAAGPLGEVILKAASADPRERFASAAEMRAALENLTASPSGNAAPAPAKKKFPLWAKLAIAAACVLAVGMGIAAVALRQLAPTVPTGSVRTQTAAGEGAGDHLHVEALSIGVSDPNIVDNQTYPLVRQFTPEGASEELAWSSSDEAVATVTPDGTLEAHTAGAVTITASTRRGITASCQVTVVSDQPTSYGGMDYGKVYDFNYYVQNCPDVAEQFAGDPEGALEFFVTKGLARGDQAIAQFNVVHYAYAYPDVRKQYGKDLNKIASHYLVYGFNEGRDGLGLPEMKGYAVELDGVDYSGVYDYNYYAATGSGMFAACGVDDQAALEYFVHTGMPRGDQACAGFSPTSYAYENKEVRDRCRPTKYTEEHLYSYYVHAGQFDYSPYYLDYINTGREQGLSGSGCDAMQDYATVYEGKDYSSLYDYNVYVNDPKNQDIKRIFGVDDLAVLEHFVLAGLSEGRHAKD